MTGYLLILIGAAISATIALPFPLPYQLLELWYRISLWGYILIAMGMRTIAASPKELHNARNFTYGAMAAALGISWLPRLIPFNTQMMFLLMGLQMFFSLGLFFWLFKAEYMWAPHTPKRVNWMLFSAVALIYLLLFLIPGIASALGVQNPNLTFTWFFVLTTVFSPAQLQPMTMLANAFVFINLLYNIVLFYILVKLYLEERRNGPSLRRWN